MTEWSGEVGLMLTGCTPPMGGRDSCRLVIKASADGDVVSRRICSWICFGRGVNIFLGESVVCLLADAFAGSARESRSLKTITSLPLRFSSSPCALLLRSTSSSVELIPPINEAIVLISLLSGLPKPSGPGVSPGPRRPLRPSH
jgi:hypothetical protein